jgi:NitT/TauT family transport system ATP-binding protein
MTSLRLDAAQASGAPTAKRGDSIIELRKVTRSFGTHSGVTTQALGEISLNFFAGEFVAIVGASGCGKTTLLKIVGGLTPASAGAGFYRGKQITGPVDDLGIVFQRPVLLEWRTVLNNIVLQMTMHRLGTAQTRRAAAKDLLERVGLAGYDDRYPWELSGGQQQRVSLCRALIHKPGLLLMDEPFGALDALTREQLQVDLESLWLAQQPLVLFVTHDVGEAVTLADRVIVLAGRPGAVVENLVIDVSRPRSGQLLDNPRLQNYAKRVRSLLGPAAAPRSNVTAIREGTL